MSKKQRKPSLSFIGVGVNKAGSSWIYECLKTHPEICMSAQREANFLGRHYYKGWGWYADQYAHCTDQKILGEFSPGYAEDDQTIERIKREYPDAKILLSIREPLDRLRSSWKFNYNRGQHNHTSFEAYLEHADNDVWQKGLYAAKLELIYAHFDPEQVFVIFFDDIKHNPTSLLRDLYTFLAVDPNHTSEYATKKINPAGKIKLKYRWINNAIFAVRAFKASHPVFNTLGQLTKRVGLNWFFIKVQKMNRTTQAQTVSFNETLSEVMQNRIAAYYRADLHALRTEYSLTLPENWTQ